MSSNFDPSRVDREMGIDDDSLRQQYGDGVNISGRGYAPSEGAPPAAHPMGDDRGLPAGISPGVTSAPSASPTFKDRFGVTLRLNEDLSGPHRATKAITYTLPFSLGLALISLLLVPMGSVIWYLVLLAFGKSMSARLYLILVGAAFALGILGLIVLGIFPVVYDMVF